MEQITKDYKGIKRINAVMNTEEIKEKIRTNIEINENGCWIWKKGRYNTGYGCISIGHQKQGLAHRVSWRAFKGEIPKGLCVLHKCDVRNCVNPDHLFLGTYQDNVDDMTKKGREPRGESSGQSKLTELKVRQIKQLLTTRVTHKEIAKRFNISRSQISAISRKEWWNHIKD